MAVSATTWPFLIRLISSECAIGAVAPSRDQSERCIAVGMDRHRHRRAGDDAAAQVPVGLDGRGAKDVEVVFAEGDAHRRGDGRHRLAEIETIAITDEKGDGLRAEVHDGDGVVLCRNAARIAADTALAECGDLSFTDLVVG